MNIVLFEPDEFQKPLLRTDERAVHILQVLRRSEGDDFDAGILNGPKGKAIVTKIGEDALSLEFNWNSDEEPALYPIDLVVGLSRPQTNRKILQDATALGVRSIRFVTTERGEPSYASSKLWTTGEWRRHVVAGVAQAFTTRMPQVYFEMSLKDAIDALDATPTRIALDNYEAEIGLGEIDATSSIGLALGSERGWTGKERELLRENGYTLAHLGPRPLRTETAAIAGIALLLEMFW